MVMQHRGKHAHHNLFWKVLLGSNLKKNPQNNTISFVSTSDMLSLFYFQSNMGLHDFQIIAFCLYLHFTLCPTFLETELHVTQGSSTVTSVSNCTHLYKLSSWRELIRPPILLLFTQHPNFTGSGGCNCIFLTTLKVKVFFFIFYQVHQALSIHFHMHGLTNAHNWLVSSNLHVMGQMFLFYITWEQEQ